MQASQTPTLVPLAFAANGTKNAIPEASQIGITPGAASLNDGFPPLTMTPIAAGGIPPSGADFNGIFNLITQSIRWQHAGGHYSYNSTFANDANVGGYPQGAQLMSADLLGTWISLNDSNTDNPDTGAGTKWVPGHAYGVTPITGLTNANVTLTPAQASKSKITLAGALTANVQIIFPTWTKEWEVVNNTTGAFTVTAKTAAGTGIALAAGQQKITGDGTNITQPAESIAAATQSQHAVQMGQLYGGLKGIFRSTSSGSLVVPTGVTTMYLTAIAGGGGGASGAPANNGSASTIGGGGGGGGGGQSVYRQPYAVTPGGTISWTIGAAGSGGAVPGAQATGNPGTAGGNTVISGAGFNGGTSVTLLGGGGGGAPNTATSGNAAGGTPGSGAPTGSYGADVTQNNASGNGGAGGSSLFGGGGGGGRGASGNSTAGTDAAGFGAGGGGGGGIYTLGIGSAGKGGNATAGIIFFEW